MPSSRKQDTGPPAQGLQSRPLADHSRGIARCARGSCGTDHPIGNGCALVLQDFLPADSDEARRIVALEALDRGMNVAFAPVSRCAEISMTSFKAYTWLIAASGVIALATLAAKATPCVTVRAIVRPNYPGYDHIVELTNACDQVAICDVATDVNPKRLQVTVDPKSKKSVLTWRGSPARVFTPRVSCMMKK